MEKALNIHLLLPPLLQRLLTYPNDFRLSSFLHHYETMTRTLPDLFHEYDPPTIAHTRLATSIGESSGGSSRGPSRTADEVFFRLPNQTLHVSHSSDILVDLSELLNDSWKDETKSKDIGSTWDMKIRIDAHQCENIHVQGEVVDLSGNFTHLLFAPVNCVAAQSMGYLKAEAYPDDRGMKKSAWTRPVKQLRMGGSSAGPDECATLRPAQGNLAFVPEYKIVMEKKGPWVDGMGIISGIDEAMEGFEIVKIEGAGRYRTRQGISPAFMDEVIQVS